MGHPAASVLGAHRACVQESAATEEPSVDSSGDNMWWEHARFTAQDTGLLSQKGGVDLGQGEEVQSAVSSR